MAAADNTLSWQSAFWGLLPLAINSMLQPVGGPTSSNYQCALARICPIVGAMDSIDSVVHVVTISIQNRCGVSRAAKQWLEDRTKLDVEVQPSSNPPIQTTQSLTPLELSPLWRFCLFVPVLAQSVKIFACSGIPWTQAFAYLYVGSFSILEILLRTTFLHEEREPSMTSTLQNASSPNNLTARIRTISRQVNELVYLSFCALPAFLFIGMLPCPVAGKAESDSLKAFAQALLTLPFFLVMMFLSIILIPWLALTWPFPDAFSKAFWFLVYFLNIPFEYMHITGPMVWYVILIFLFFSFIAVSMRIATEVLTTFVSRAAQGAAIFVGVSSSTGITQSDILFLWQTLYFFLAGLVGYMVKYNSEGTFKPAWANRLG